ncbi:MAG: outer membrane lipoprotein carrier protein LolA [Bacteroidota bacterium]
MESKKATLALLFILSISLLPVFGSVEQREFTPVENMEAMVELINANALKTESIQSNFIQTKQLEFLDETIVSKGKFWFRKENSLRWVYETPYEYAIIIHNGKFHIRDGEQVNSYDIESNAVFREINDLIVGMVQGDVANQDKFELAAFESGNQFLIRLVPREADMRKVISEMEVYFDKDDLMVSEIVMNEGESDRTVITFVDRRINETIPDAVFTTGY